MASSCDFIGDIHGQADKLEALLFDLGYRHRAGAWRHPHRQAMFVGDFIDRGPGQLRVLGIVRDMVEAGAARAILGNHEFNALAFSRPDPERPGEHLRRRTDKNRRQHRHFLEEVGEDSPAHGEWMDWFMDLPLWLEGEDFRMVHACWHAPSQAALAPHLAPGNRLTWDLVQRASRPGTPEYEALEVLCKGLEVALPAGVDYADAEGTRRTASRTRWWDPAATTYRAAALLPPRVAAQLPATDLPAHCRIKVETDKPIFFGHYWFTGTPGVVSESMCCVDYSAARDGHPLVAYRFDGESRLSSDKLVAVGAAKLRPPCP